MTKSNEFCVVINAATVSPETLDAPLAVAAMAIPGKKKPGQVTIMRPPIGINTVGLNERVAETPVLKLNLSASDIAKDNPVIQDLMKPLMLTENGKPTGGSLMAPVGEPNDAPVLHPVFSEMPWASPANAGPSFKPGKTTVTLSRSLSC
jgi:hypothetical protein